MLKLGRHEKAPEPFLIGVERGMAGYSAAWCLDLPGRYVLIPPGAELEERMELAILEHTAWSHQRSADRLMIAPGQLQTVQSLHTGEDVRRGATSVFFAHDAEPPRSNEFPAWANPHDRAVDELRELALSLPMSLQHHRLDARGRTLIDTVHHAATTERHFAELLRPGGGGAPRPADDDPTLRELLEAHTWLQQVVCDVPTDRRLRYEAEPGAGEEWSVRKVMRRSIWHLRYHTWELKKAIAGIWLD